MKIILIIGVLLLVLSSGLVIKDWCEDEEVSLMSDDELNNLKEELDSEVDLRYRQQESIKLQRKLLGKDS